MLKEKSDDDYIRLCILYVKIKITQYMVEKSYDVIGVGIMSKLNETMKGSSLCLTFRSAKLAGSEWG